MAEPGRPRARRGTGVAEDEDKVQEERKSGQREDEEDGAPCHRPEDQAWDEDDEAEHRERLKAAVHRRVQRNPVPVPRWNGRAGTVNVRI